MLVMSDGCTELELDCELRKARSLCELWARDLGVDRGLRCVHLRGGQLRFGLVRRRERVELDRVERWRKRRQKGDHARGRAWV